MQTQNSRFIAASNKQDIRPRITIAIHFADSVGDIVYFTTHQDCGRSEGAPAVIGCVQSLSGGTQKIDAKNSSSSIGSVSFKLVDIDGQVSQLLAQRNANAQSLRQRKVVIYYGYGPYLTSDDTIAIETDDEDETAGYPDIEQTDWLDYQQQFTMLIKDVSIGSGFIDITADDIQRLELKELFIPDKTTLLESITAEQMHIPAALQADTDQFQTLEHDNSYSDRPGQTVGYIKIANEVICHQGISVDPTYGVGFSVVERGALNTQAVGHNVDANASDDRKTPITEYIYLEGPALKLLYAIQTGVLYDQSGTLPAHWHHGIDPNYVRLSDYTNADPLLWEPSANTGRKLRFTGLTKTNGQQFIEKEILTWLAGIRPIYSDGAIGFKRLASVLSDSDYVCELNNTNITSIGQIEHRLRDVINTISIEWDYSDIKEKFLQTTQVIDQPSITKYKDGEPKTLQFKGVKSSNQTDSDLRAVFDNYRNRYAGGGYALEIEVLPKINFLEVGDNVRVNTPNIIDPLTAGPIDRVFEVQQMTPNWRSGRVKLSLFASTEAAGEFEVISSGNVLADEFYTETGNNIASLPQCTDGVITADVTLTGGETLAGGIWYHDGDLTLPSGITMHITDNVQLRVKGVFTRNGDIIGVGAGFPGGVGGTVFNATNSVSYETGLGSDGNESRLSAIYGNKPILATNETPGIAGYMGVSAASNFTLAIGFSVKLPSGSDRSTIENPELVIGYVHASPVLAGRNADAPRLSLLNRDGSGIEGVGGLDLRGTSGSGSRPLIQGIGVSTYNGIHEILQPGANGGNGGAGLMVICRGESVGAGSIIDLSGEDGEAVAPFTAYHDINRKIANGGGGGGMPGAYYLLIDGSATFGTGPTNVLQQRGVSGIAAGSSLFAPANEEQNRWETSAIADGAIINFGVAAIPVTPFGQSGYKVQYIPAPQNVEQLPDETPKYKLQAVSGINLESGTAQLLPAADGGVRERIKATWSASTEAQAGGYEVQARVDGSVWRTVAVIEDTATPLAYIDVTGGELYLVRVRVYGGADTIASEWLVSGNHVAVGKLEAPAAPTGFSATVDPLAGVLFLIDPHPAPDFSHYRIYNGVNEITRGDFVRELWSPTSAGQLTFYCAAYDRSGNASEMVSTQLTITAPGDPAVTHNYQGTDFVIEWEAAQGTFATKEYVIRLGGVVVARTQSTQWRKTVDFTGSRTYTITHVDIAGSQSAAVPVIVQPLTPQTPEIIGKYSDVNIVLRWQDCAQSLPIKRYGVTFDDVTYYTSQPYFALEVGWLGSLDIIVTAEDTAGNVSSAAIFSANPVAPGVPILRTQVIDNSLTMFHKSARGSLPIREYRIYKMDTFNAEGDYESVGGSTTFSVLDQLAAGVYTIWVVAVDSAGNTSEPASTAAVVSQPPDYVLVAEHSEKAAGWVGAKTNCLVNSQNALLLPVITDETWEQHFVNNSFSTPQDQINAGYEQYMQPSAETAQYAGEYDYGAIIPASMITIMCSPQVLDGGVSQSTTIAYRESASDPWTYAEAGSTQIFAESFRYVRFEINFSASGGDDLALVEDIIIKIDKKLVKDAGSAAINASDSGGTFVPFNLNFISAYTPLVTFSGDYKSVIDYSAGANPTGFYVYLYDSNGTRASANIDWFTNGFTGV